MGRAAVWTVAGTAIAAAVVLTLLGVGDDPNALPNWQALILGLVQGVTELLPISSSGHLIIVPWLGDWEYLKEHDAFNQTFDVALHLGTLVAVVAYFWRDLIGLLTAWLHTLRTRRVTTAEERVAWFVVVATIPAAIVGFLGEDLIAEHLGEPWQIAIALVVFAGLLWVADRQPERRGMDGLGPREALAIGAAQSLALMPGVSTLGDHDHGRAVPRPRPRFRRARLVLPARADRARGGAAEGLAGRRSRRAAAGLDGAVRGRNARRRRERPARDRLAPRLRPPPRLLDLRLVPADRRRSRDPPDPHGRALGRLLSARPIPLLVAGAACIAFSGILVRLADVTPSTAAFYRCFYALPALLVIALVERRRYGSRERNARLLAWIAGCFFAADLIFWHHSIAAVGAGLATVLGNVQVVLVPIAAWLLLSERPAGRVAAAVPVVLIGVVLISGVVGAGAYGSNPALGVFFGLLTAVAYAGFLLTLRAGSSDVRRSGGALFHATLACTIAILVAGWLLDDLELRTGWESFAWLVTLALTSQVLGWLLIAAALPRAPAAISSVVLTLQPVAAVLLAIVLIDEDPSAVQLAGVAVVVCGIVLATGRGRSVPT